MTVEMTSWKWHLGEFSLAEGRMGWDEEGAAWGSPVPYLKFRQGMVRLTFGPPPPSLPQTEERTGREGGGRSGYVLGRNGLQELVLYWLNQWREVSSSGCQDFKPK